MAMLVILETFSPDERAVFVLHEVFGFSHTEIAEAVAKSPAAVGRSRIVPGSTCAAADCGSRRLATLCRRSPTGSWPPRRSGTSQP